MVQGADRSAKRQLLIKITQGYIESDISKYVSHVLTSVIIGLLAGTGAIVFHHLLYMAGDFLRPDNFMALTGKPVFFIILIPVAGGLVCSAMTTLYPGMAKEKGVISVIRAIIIRKGYIPVKETLFHFVMPVISIGSGAPLGPEGPSAKIGSGIGSFMSQIFRHGSSDMMMYTAAGGGAAIAAVFNAPIAGVFFGIEVILLNDLKNRALSALIIASVTAEILSLAVHGNERIFSVPGYCIGNISTYPYYILLGIACGIISLLYFIFSGYIKRLLNEKLKIHSPFLRLVPVTFVFGIVIVYNPDLSGIGYTAINSVLHGHVIPTQVFIMMLLKVLFLALFLQAGAFGGSFAPALSIGAFLGFSAACGSNYLLGTNLDPTAFALAGMGGVLAGINSIPLTSILLVFEVTHDYGFILPLMLSSIIAYLATLYHRKGSEYSLALMDENIDVTKKGDLDIFSKTLTGSIIRDDMDTVDFRTPFRHLSSVILDAKYGDVFVTDRHGRYMGIITLKDVRRALLDNDLAGLLIAGDLAINIPPVTPSDPVSLAIKRIREYSVENIPVVSSDGTGKLIGIITHGDIIETYYKTLDNLAASEFLL